MAHRAYSLDPLEILDLLGQLVSTELQEKTVYQAGQVKII
jgi:hypothetical protein